MLDRCVHEMCRTEKNSAFIKYMLKDIFLLYMYLLQVLARGTKYDDLNEVAKLFTIHDD